MATWNTKYTDYVKVKYNNKEYYIRAWLKYQNIESTTKKTFVFTAGFQTKKEKCTMGVIKLNVKSSKTAQEGKGNISREKEFKGTSATSSITYIDETTWVWEPDEENIEITLTADFKSTRFSGKKCTLTHKMVGDKIDFTTARVGETTSATLTMTVNRGDLSNIYEPTISRAPTNSERQSKDTFDTINGLTWKIAGTNTTISFPYKPSSLPDLLRPSRSCRTYSLWDRSCPPDVSSST